MATINFHFRPSEREGRHMGSIYIRVIHERKSGSVTTPYRVYPEEWDSENGRVRLCGEDPARLERLAGIDTQLHRSRIWLTRCADALEIQGSYTVGDILAFYRRKGKDGILLSKYTEELCGKLEGAGRVRTARAYRTVSNGIIRFNKHRDIRMDDIDDCLLHRFEDDLKLRGRSLNTISFYMRNLRAIYNKGVRAHLVRPRPDNPFAGVYTGVHVTKKRALTKKEITRLAALDLSLIDKHPESDATLPDKDMRDSLALFMFSFHARGMSFVDMAYLRKENIHNGVLSYFRKKTGQFLEIALTPALHTLIGYFAEATKDSPFLLPVIKTHGCDERRQYESGLRVLNLRLKKLAKLAGVNKPLTTHVARHSWATIAKKENYPLAVISEGLGHSNERTTRIYLASFERSVIDKVNEEICRTIKKAV